MGKVMVKNRKELPALWLYLEDERTSPLSPVLGGTDMSSQII
jgi:hypothetical protein